MRSRVRPGSRVVAKSRRIAANRGPPRERQDHFFLRQLARAGPSIIGATTSGNRLLDPLYLRTFCPGMVLSRVFGRNISVTVPSDLLPRHCPVSGLWAQHFGSGKATFGSTVPSDLLIRHCPVSACGAMKIDEKVMKNQCKRQTVKMCKMYTTLTRNPNFS